MQVNSRIETLDIAKGIGFFLVVLGHLVPSGGTVSIFIFSFHMPLFFIIAGYFIPEKATLCFYSRRVVTLGINYIVFSLMGLVVTLLVPSWRNALTKNTLFFDAIYNTQPECIHVGQIWFLAAMFWAVTLFFVIHRMFNDSELPCIITSFAVAAISIILSSEKVKIPFGGALQHSI